MLSGYLLEPATDFAGSSMTMASLIGFVCTFAASDNRLSSVYCLKVPDDRAVVDSTALTGRGGGHVTCLAASFHILSVMVFSNCLLANSSITSVTHSEGSPAFLLSQWRTFSSSSVPSFHSGQAVGALNLVQPSLIVLWIKASVGPKDCNTQGHTIWDQVEPFFYSFAHHVSWPFSPKINFYPSSYKSRQSSTPYLSRFSLRVSWGMSTLSFSTSLD